MRKAIITLSIVVSMLMIPTISSANYENEINIIDDQLPGLIDSLEDKEGRQKVDLAKEINELKAKKKTYEKAIEYIESKITMIDEPIQINKANYVDKYTPPKEYIPIYKMAAERYNVDWEYLAAIHSIETNYSTLSVMVSTAGAVGHSQFMPCTWIGWSHPTCSGLGRGNITQSELSDMSKINKYGGYGVDGNGDGQADPWNIYDAIHSTANYLNKSGFTKNKYNAIFTYNRADWYVKDVINRAENISSVK